MSRCHGAVAFQLRRSTEPRRIASAAAGSPWVTKVRAGHDLRAARARRLVAREQERKSERALEALRELSSPRALVLRDGRWRRIPGRDVVAGDLIRLTEGDRIPADAELIECANLAADEILSLPRDRPTARTRVHSFPLAPGQPSLAHVWPAEGEATCVVAAALFVEPVSELFRFVAPTLAQLAAAAAAGFSGLAAIELVTRLLPRTRRATAQIG